MSAFSFIKSKLAYELKRAKALATYKVHEDALVAALSQTMPNVAIELTNICNANCTFCAYQFQSRPQGVMSEETYRKVINEFADCGGGMFTWFRPSGVPLLTLIWSTESGTRLKKRTFARSGL